MVVSLIYYGSECWKNIEYTNDYECLINIRRHVESAANSKELDDENISFFKEAREHVKSKIEKYENKMGETRKGVVYPI
jgi:hypothetical protein